MAMEKEFRMTRERQISVSMLRIYFFVLFILSINSVYAFPLWEPPIFVDPITEWHYVRISSPDSSAFELRKKKIKIVFDYYRKMHEISKPICSIADVRAAVSLHGLACFTTAKYGTGLRFSLRIQDSYDPSYLLDVSIISNSLGRDENDILKVVRSIEFIGNLNEIKLIEIDMTKRSAIIVDEMKIPRAVKVGSRIGRNFALVKKIELRKIQVEETILDADGEYKTIVRSINLNNQ
jgi:hypothetical protein